jgi:glycosyltransferase involved in cell wall biosynthesis
MKILQYPAYITICGNKSFSRSTTGYGYMALDIATSIAAKNIKVDLLTQSNITKGFYFEDIHILKRTWKDIFSNLKFSHLFTAIKIISTNQISLRKIPNIILYNISMGYFEKILIQNDYDLVHIHGISYSTLPIINVCKKKQIPFLVTLHGLYSFANSTGASEKLKQLEKDFLIEAFKDKIPVTVISTGIKRTILDFLNKRQLNNFDVITNGCNITTDNLHTDLNIRERYQIPPTKKIMICVGNISIRKNQSQIVKAYLNLPQPIKNDLVILFLGADGTNGQFQNEIDKTDLKNRLIYCGNIPKNEMPNYLDQADYNIVASISEGFGLSIIEGFVFGLPCLTFSDLDAVPDLYHPNAMLLVENRSDNALTNGIEKMIVTNWNKKFIQEYAQKFTLEKMAEEYINFYEKTLNEINKKKSIKK